MPKLLIISSNPRRDLNLDREVSDLTTAVQRLGEFEIALGLGARAQELPELLSEHSPEFVHFCGHGAGEEGLVFQNEQGQERLVSTEVLVRLFSTFADEVDCIVLNACDSDHQAKAIVAHINYAVGMNQEILDQAAHVFAVGFYKALAHGKSIETAYDLGCLAIQFWSEDQVQATQPGRYRKATVVGEVSLPVAADLAEHLKPVLRKKSVLASPTGQGEAVSAALLPTGFEQDVRQEIDRKEYKDQARNAYDQFGNFSTSQATELTKQEYEQRRIVISKVKSFWIEGFLKPSLQGINALSLDLKARPDAIANLAEGIETLSVELDDSYDQLQGTQIYQDMVQGRTLLILGDPGAGKTIALLQLAQRLIKCSEENLALPMPIVFNLASWASERKPIINWLIDELREKYQVPKALSEPWITHQQLILLLDGLDEVNEGYRNDCVRALNEFIGLFPQTEMAVCSRVKDYEALTARLQISSALCLQPLTPKQIYQFLDGVGGPLAGLKALLQNDHDLEQFAQPPLILNLMSAAYQGWSVERLRQELSTAPDREDHLFNTYIERRLERGVESIYPKAQVLQWLSWLASKMMKEKQIIFLIEKMQPPWLKNRHEQALYRISTFVGSVLTLGLIYGLFFGLSSGLFLGLIYGLFFGLSYGLFFGISSGLIFGPLFGLITILPKKILLLEQVSWSWRRARSIFIRESLTGIIIGLISGLIIGPIFGLYFGLTIGLITGLIAGSGSGLMSTEIVYRTVPNQGIRTSLKNSLVIGLIYWLIFWPPFALFFGVLGDSLLHVMSLLSYREPDHKLIDLLAIGLIFGLIFGLFSALISGLKYGGAACIQHFSLRQFLYYKGRIPWNYAKFLDFASSRLLMKKVGGGYVFFHRMLLEHFASMYDPQK